MSNALSVVKPIEIKPAMLVSTDVPEADYPVWTSGTTYALDARVIRSNAVWQSLEAGNAGNTPESSLTKWVKVEATNRWKAFDKVVGTQTKQASKITYRLKPGLAWSTIAALNVTAGTSMTVKVYHGTRLVKEVTVGLWLNASGTGWWNWWFGQRFRPTQVIIDDLPGLQAAEVVIEINGTADLGVGLILLGRKRTFGLGVLMGARVGITDYSRKERDDWGNVQIVERAFARRASFPLMVKANEVDEFQRFIADMRATPCLWSGGSRYESTTVYGLLRSAETVISYFDHSEVDIELEGLV